MTDKEKIYDEQIFPLMKQVIEICKREQLPMFAEFQYADEGFVKTLIEIKEGFHPLITMLEALSQCIEGEGVNIDKFVLWLMKTYKNKSSMALKILGSEIDRPNENPNHP